MYETKKGNGDWTIGYGHRLTGAELNSGIFKNGITKEKAEELFKKDIQDHVNGIYRNVSNAVYLTQNQFDALVSASFNMGWSSFSESSIKKAVVSFGANIGSLNTNDFKAAISNAFRIEVPLRSHPMHNGLKNRRVNEYQIFIHGDYKRDETPAHLLPSWSVNELP